MTDNNFEVDYDDQQCFKIRFNGREYYARFPRDAHGFYLVLWSQGELHGNGPCPACCNCETLPIIEFGTTTFYASLRSCWEIMPAVVVRLWASTAEHVAMSARLENDLARLGSPTGPCKEMGLMTGGGLPHGSYPNAMRGVAGVDDIMRRIWHYDGRLVPGVPYVKTREALLLATSGQKSELPYHRDNNIFDDSPQCYRLQAAILQHPPALDNYTRTGALLSLVPATVSIKRTMAEILCTRDSQCECGKPGKGAMDRQAPTCVLCGPRMKAQQAKKSSMA